LSESKREEDKTTEEREFQLEMLRFQTKYSLISSSALTFLAIEVSTFVSLAVTYLSVGLMQNNLLYILIAVLAIVALIASLPLTTRYFDSKKVRENIEKNLDKELQPMRKRFITKEKSKT
jgi:low affinity Fe/Cu permease